MRILTIILLSLTPLLAHPPEFHDDPFRQLEEVLPTPGDTRTASGAPGHRYWQQQADYDIAVTLDEIKHTISGTETITYHNNSPDTLSYLWLQLDRNRHHPQAAGHQSYEAPNFDDLKFDTFRNLLHTPNFDGSYRITSVTTADGKKLPHSIVQTMMRVDLPTGLKPGEKIQLKLAWNFPINNRLKTWARSGYETFPKDKNTLYQIAQFFPRMCAYTDVNGWQNKQFLGRGEFALEFGNYRVAITVPADHTIAATGTLANPDDIYSQQTRDRLNQARSAQKPVFIITPDEAKQAIKTQPGGKGTKINKTWIFTAENVRDFAFASSRRFIWDAIEHTLPGTDKKVWAMSYYPPEAEPLWSQYSTHSVVHTLNVYSRITFDYPYPTAISVHGKIFGMEYPMISFNGARPEEDGTYSEKLKKSLISVIIHEVGHNWFPMIVNSDERQWTWMDEGLNSFLQNLAEEEWSDKPYNVPVPQQKIIKYMTSDKQRPIMTNSESILQFGPNAYRKPAAALHILRESIMGRELFDFAFKEYSTRWRFKRPQPADFFRTMEDASGMDLDWFWHGWFYTTKHNDIALTNIEEYKTDTKNPTDKKTREKEEHTKEKSYNHTHRKNKNLPKYSTARSELVDFYDKHDPFKATEKELKEYQKSIKDLSDEDKALWKAKGHFYRLTFKNIGGLVSPIILNVTDNTGATEQHRLPAEIWKKHTETVHKLLITKSPITSIVIDPDRETADADHSNNAWPRKIDTKHFPLVPDKDDSNPIRDAKEKAEEEAKEDKKTKP